MNEQQQQLPAAVGFWTSCITGRQLCRPVNPSVGLLLSASSSSQHIFAGRWMGKAKIMRRWEPTNNAIFLEEREKARLVRNCAVALQQHKVPPDKAHNAKSRVESQAGTMSIRPPFVRRLLVPFVD
ncbi:hypothetical protein GPALN_011993 [Globodera pallida]|nr:hypothetical protein GPALN_011993 [Globodera pallida]